ncbi:Protein of unknown function [Pyronema omphalodes CBS 100304]|uniref:Uncharacterized protein n=1 Tax=Pyronema omphalodes (strain CBS 100304) TaxID=1076935 RepID=U4L363_PYROM|nr:Protein of unknown function [Pyronema omphalodes CBS 100304]
MAKFQQVCLPLWRFPVRRGSTCSSSPRSAEPRSILAGVLFTGVGCRYLINSVISVSTFIESDELILSLL